MFGAFDMDGVTSGPALALGEAMLDAQCNNHAPTICHIHHAASAATAGNGAFMFGVNAEQPMLLPSDELILTVWVADQP
jgi:hypothetical protein